MPETLFIDKKQITETESDYDLFFKTGLEMLQKYSGEIWTDYNIHDPGVTILEQLCYALSELKYKSTFEVENYFVDKNNEIPFEKLGLLEPYKCIPNACITINDFRKAIFDEVKEIGNIWIEKDNNNIKGLLKIYVDIADHLQLTEALKEHVKTKILKAFVKQRNITEDISEIIILEREYWELCGEIEVHTIRSIHEVYGDIFVACSRYVASNLAYRSVRELVAMGMELPEILNGPLLKNGCLLETDFAERSRIIDISEMVSRIKKIPGVEDVNSLFIRCNGKEIFDEVPYCEKNRVKAIRIPVGNENIALRVTSKGKWYQASTKNVSDEVYKQLVYDPSFPQYITDLKNSFQYQKGIYRDFNNYYSIQNNFPNIYGISYEGLSGNESPERKAKAKQLKAYLYFFEQIMADYLESIQNIKKLFSANDSGNATYFSKFLNDSNIPGIEELYTDKDRIPANLRNVLDKYDNQIQRRSEILDFVLSIYGLEFKQHSLRHYIKVENEILIEKKIIENKQRYLKYVPLVTGRSSKGINYLESELKPENFSGIELQLLLRSGIDPADNNQIEKVFLIEHILLRPSHKIIKSENSGFYQFSVTIVFPGFRGRYVDTQFRMLVLEIIDQYTPAHINVNCLWCDQSEWRKIEPVYFQWRTSLKGGIPDRDKKAEELITIMREIAEGQ